jgi:hypothetical protein
LTVARSPERPSSFLIGDQCTVGRFQGDGLQYRLKKPLLYGCDRLDGTGVLFQLRPEVGEVFSPRIAALVPQKSGKEWRCVAIVQQMNPDVNTV